MAGRKKPSFKVTYTITYTYTQDDEPAAEDEINDLFDEDGGVYNAGAIDQAVRLLASVFKLTEREMWKRIFVAGILYLLEKMDLMGHKSAQAFRIALFTRDRAVSQNGQRQIQFIRDTTSDEEWADFCKTHGVDPDGYVRKVFASAKATADMFNWNAQVSQWLSRILSDGEEHDPSELEAMAKRDGLVKTAKDWNNVRVLASRLGYSSQRNRGKWKLVPKEMP